MTTTDNDIQELLEMEKALIECEIPDEFPTTFHDKFLYHYQLYVQNWDIFTHCREKEKAQFYFSKAILELTQGILVARDNAMTDKLSTILQDAADLYEYVNTSSLDHIKKIGDILHQELFEK